MLVFGFDEAGEQLVAGRVVAGGFWDGDLVGGIVGEAEAEIVGLQAVVGGADVAARTGLDFG